MHYVMNERLVPLITEKDIREKVFQLAQQIAAEYKGKSLTVLTVLRGGFIFAADLLRELQEIGGITCIYPEFIVVQSYTGKSRGKPQFKYLPDEHIFGSHVLIVDDICDSSTTIQLIEKGLISYHGAASVQSCVLLHRATASPGYRPTFVGFGVAADLFAVGYGMDYYGQFRTLPAVYSTIGR